MLELIAAFAFGAGLVVVLVVMIGLAPSRGVTKATLFTIAGAWAVSVVGFAAAGGFALGMTGPVPTVALFFAPVVVAGLAAWFLWSPFRAALMAIPLPALVGIHAARVLGGAFLILYADGRLAAPFAPMAGWGDILAGVLAVPVALVSLRTVRRGMVAAWNALGAADLALAIGVGVLSAPGPLQFFTEPPGTAVIGTLPWVLVPTVLVPLFLLSHVVIAAKLGVARARYGTPLPA